MFSRNKSIIFLFIIFSLFITSCSEPIDEEESQKEVGELVPSFTIYTSTPETDNTTYEAVQMISKEWEELGFDVLVEPMDYHALVDRLWAPDERDFDAFTIRYSGRVERMDPDMFIYSIFHSSLSQPENSNTTGFSNEVYDELATAQRHEMNMEKRREYVFKAQEILTEEAPVISLYSSTLAHAFNKERFENLLVMPGEGIFSEWMPVSAVPLTDDKQLRIGSVQDIDTLNPVTANSVYDWRNLRLVYDKLVRLSPEMEPTPAAAVDWEVIDDTTVDFTLREGMLFHDGEIVDAEDIKFSFDFMAEWHDGYLQSFLEPIKEVEVINPYNIRFHLKEPYAPLLTATLTQIPILPKHIWEHVEGRPTDHPNLDAIGSGPFVFDYWRRGEELSFLKNPHFYEEIAIDGYTYQIFGQHEGVLTALEKGEIDTNAEHFIPAHMEHAEEINHLKVIEVPDIGYDYIGFNLRRSPFDDRAVRQALALTVDYDLIVEAFLDGHGKTGGPGLVIQEANEYWHNPAAAQPEFNPAKAREILKEAGYTWDNEKKLRLPVEQ